MELFHAPLSKVALCLFDEHNQHFQFGTAVQWFSVNEDFMRSQMKGTESFPEPNMDQEMELLQTIKACREKLCAATGKK